MSNHINRYAKANTVVLLLVIVSDLLPFLRVEYRSGSAAQIAMRINYKEYLVIYDIRITLANMATVLQY